MSAPPARRRLRLGDTTLQAPYGLAPFNSGLFRPDGSLGRAGLSFYRSFCDRSLGLLCIGGLAVAPEGRANRSSLCLDRDEYAGGLRDVCEMAHAAGIAVVVQIEHAGRQTGPAETGLPSVAATGEPCPVVGGSPLSLTGAGVTEVIDRFARAAEIAVRAGADLVEVHAAHGYLLSGFLSASTNKREDDYGGTVEGRFRIVRQIVRRIRDTVGDRVGVRINVHEQHPEGMTPGQVIAGLDGLRDALAYVSVSGGMYAREGDVIIPRRTLPRAL